MTAVVSSGTHGSGGRWRSAGALVQLVRPHQWIKNAFVLAPLLLTPEMLTAAALATALLGTLCFCAVSSAVYVLNDWIDRAADRMHPAKCRRPLAAGTVRPGQAFALAAVLAVAGLGGAAALGGAFPVILLGYFGLNLAYCLRLKHVSIVDVIVISIGFVLRVEGGGALAGVRPTVWIVVCTALLALFLAIAKRRDDLVRDLGENHRKALEGYNLRFLDSALTIVSAALLVSYALYTADAQVIARLGSGHLYVTIPFVLAGVLRYLQITVVEERSASPTVIVLTDRFLILAIGGWIATFGALIYA